MKYIYATVFALGLVVSGLGSPQAAQAAGLTEAQINAVVSLVASFGADAQTVHRVESSLRGGSVGSSPASTTRPDDDKDDHDKDKDKDKHKNKYGKKGEWRGKSCLALNRNLRPGSHDAITAGEVSRLQKFLIEEGEFPEALVTGYFGSATGQALARWQAQQGLHNVSSSTGVGPMTRDMMRKKCKDGLPQHPVSTSTSSTTGR